MSSSATLSASSSANLEREDVPKAASRLASPAHVERNLQESSLNDPEQFLSYAASVRLVTGVGRSLDFDERRLAFSTECRSEASYASVLRGGGRLHLKQSPRAARHQPAFEAPGNVDACFGAPAVEALASAFEAAGAPFSVPLRTMPDGKECDVRDPDGHVLAFVQGA